MLKNDIVVIGQVVLTGGEASGKGDSYPFETYEPTMGKFVRLSFDQAGHMHPIIRRYSDETRIESLVIERVQ